MPPQTVILKSIYILLVAPGDTGTIELFLENNSESVALAEGVEITVAGPSCFIVKNTSLLGPVSEEPAQKNIFIINYEIGHDAPEGSFSANLKFKATTPNVVPDPDVELASVDFTRNFLISSVV